MDQQIPLPLKLPDYAVWDAVYAGPNEMTIHDLQAFSTGQGEQFVFLAGELGTGKTLLLQTVCQTTHHNQQTSLYLSLSEFVNYGPAVLENISAYQYVCLDDLEIVAGQSDWEDKLFILFNAIRDQQHHLLIAANAVPAQLTIALPDLQSRLQSGLVCQLKRLTDQELCDAFTYLAQHVGLSLPQDVSQFLLRRVPRTIGQLYNIFQKLNEASFAAERRLTIPFVKEVLAI